MGRIPDALKVPLGGIFRIPDKGAKWNDPLRRFGAKSTVHRWFQTCVRNRVFESIMRDAGRCVEKRGGYRLYECSIDGMLSKAPWRRRWRWLRAAIA